MKPIMLAPMAGITDKPFRQIVRLFGPHVLHTEMIGVESLSRHHPATIKLLDLTGEKDIIVQLVGVNPDAFVNAVHLAEEAGAVGIDINMGCPVKKLITNGSGAALLKDPIRAARLVEMVKKTTNLPVSVKMRIGWDEQNINAVSFAQDLEAAGVDRLTIHGRTKSQGYSGHANWDVIRQVKEAVSVPVFANGDIVDLFSTERAFSQTKSDGIMIGRGALGKPWLLSEIETGIRPKVNKISLIGRHLDLMLDYYGPHGLYVARKHIAWYARGQKNVAEFCQKVYAETEVRKVKEMIAQFFREDV